MAETQLDSMAGLPVDSAAGEKHVHQQVAELLTNSDYAATARVGVEPSEIDFSVSPLSGVDKPFEAKGPVLALSPDLPAAEIPETPENQLRGLLDGLGSNPSPEALANAEGPILEAIQEQMGTTNQAGEQFQSYEGVEDLVQAEPSYDEVFKLFGTEMQSDGPFSQNMQLLQHYVFTGQSEGAASAQADLLRQARPEGRGALMSYFDTLNRLANENPGIAKEYSTLFQTFQNAYEAQERMVRDLDNHPAGTFIFNK